MKNFSKSTMIIIIVGNVRENFKLQLTAMFLHLKLQCLNLDLSSFSILNYTLDSFKL